MNVCVLNAGSGTLKAAWFANPHGPIGEPQPPSWARTADAADGRHHEAATRILRDVPSPTDVVGHRVVHGGTAVRAAIRLDARVRAALDQAAPLAPIHGPAALAVIDAATEALPDAVHVIVPDTAFHAQLPDHAAAYAGPYQWFEHGLRRYGFHGIAHEYAAHRAAAILGRPIDDICVVSCHLGGGCSAAAIDRGRSVDTTMGFTPLEGLPMATRCGSVDPGLLVHLLRTGTSLDDLEDTLLHRSGLRGLAGHAHLPDVTARRRTGDARARLAADLYLHRLRGAAAAMIANLDRLDAVIVSGGAGEQTPEVADTLRDLLRRLHLDAPVLVEAAREDWVIALAAPILAASS